MKKLLFTLAVTLLPLLMMAQGWPANYGGVMLQGFFWDSWTSTPLHGPQGGNLNFLNPDYAPENGYTWATMYGAGWSTGEEWQVPLTTWSSLLAHKNEIAPYIDLLWLPQSGSTICPPRSKYYKASDNSGRNGWRAWRGGEWYEFKDGDEINDPDCMGFVPVFYFHHGTNGTATPWTYTYQWGGKSADETKTFTPLSYFGTEPELRQLISEYRAAGTGAVEDVVANHRGCFGTWDFVNDNGNITYNSTKANLDFPEEDYTGQFAGLGWDAIVAGQRSSGTERIVWDLNDVCRDDESAGAGGHPQGDFDCGGKGEWARDIDHHTPATRAKVVKYLDFLRNDLGYIGFRYDYAMGFEGVHYGEYNTILRPPYSVGEYWGSQTDISNWIASTYMEGANQSAAFDFPLMYAINDAFNNWNFRGLKDAGLIGDHDMRRYAVTFVDNHDTAKDLPTDGSNKDYANRTNHNIVQANAFILAMPGTPCLFYPHFMHPDWHAMICNMIQARRAAGVHNMSEIVSTSETGNNGITWIVQGSNGQVCLQLGDAATGDTPSGFQEVYRSPNGEAPCRYSITAGLNWQNNTKAGLVMGYPIVSRGTCAFNGSITINVKPSLNGVTLVYTTDGSEPTTSTQTRIVDPAGINLTFTETTQLKVGVITTDVNNNPSVQSVQSVQSYTYAESGDDANSVTIYVQADDAPNLYLWSNKSDYKPNGGWAGNKTTETKTVKGVTWHCKTFPLPNYSEGEYYNLIINWDGGSQSHTISGITSDRYFIYANHQPIDVTEQYIGNLLKLEADKEAGIYDGDLEVNLTASTSDLTIVYTTDGTAPTAASAQFTGSGTVKITGAGEHVLRAALLVDGEVINELTRSYIIEETTLPGTRIFVRTETAPHLFIYNAVVEGEGSQNWPGVELTQKVKDEDNKTWYYYENENLLSCDIVLSNGGTGTSNQTENITGLTAGDHYFVYNNGGYYLDVTNLVHKSYFLFEPGTSQWLQAAAKIKLYEKTVSEGTSNYSMFLLQLKDGNLYTGDNFMKIGGSNGGNDVFLWYNDNYTSSVGEAMTFKRMNPDNEFDERPSDQGGGQWNYTNTTYSKGGYYYIDNNSFNVALGTASYDNFKYPSLTHKIGDIDEMLLSQVEATGVENSYYAITEDLTVGYVYGDAIYAYNASVDADLMQTVADGQIDYVKQMWNGDDRGNTAQRNWVKLTGSTGHLVGVSIGSVLSNVTGRLTDDVNTTLQLVCKPIVKGQQNVQLNTYTPCNFLESQSQTSEFTNQTYFFFHPQINEVARIMSAVYKGDGVFEVPARTNDTPDHHWINAAGLEGSITVDVTDINTDGWKPDSVAVDFDALITVNAGSSASNAPRRAAAANNGYNIKAVNASTPYDYVVTAITDVNAAAGKQVASVQYVDLTGKVSNRPFDGINIVVTRFTDGTVSTRKVVH